MAEEETLKTIFEINLDLSQPSIVHIPVPQYDTVRTVKANLFNSGVKWLVPKTHYVAVVGFKKADRIGGFYDATEDGILAVSVDKNDRSIIYILLDRNMLTTPGDVTAEITFYDTITKGRLSTFSFHVDVQEASLTELDLSSNPYFNVLASDIAAVLQAEQSMTNLTAEANNTGLNPGDQPTASCEKVEGEGYHFTFGIPPGEVPTVTGVTTTYQAGDSSGIEPAGTWQSYVPAISSGDFLWTKTSITFNNDNTHIVDIKSAARQGQDGSGTAGTRTPRPNSSTPSVGESTNFAREDHQHQMPFPYDIHVNSGQYMVFFGDSWTVGCGTDDYASQISIITGANGSTRYGYPSQSTERFSTRLAQKFGKTERNFAIGGARFNSNSGSASFASQLSNAMNGKTDGDVVIPAMTDDERNDTAYVVVLGGLNDYRKMSDDGATLTSFADAIQSFMNNCHTAFPNAVIVAGLCNAPQFGFPATFQHWIAGAQRRVSQALGFPLIVVQNTAESIGGSRDNFTSTYDATNKIITSGDPLHPNSTGHEKLAAHFMKAIMGGGTDVEYWMGPSHSIVLQAGVTMGGSPVTNTNVYKHGHTYYINPMRFEFSTDIAAGSQRTVAKLADVRMAPREVTYYPIYLSNVVKGSVAITGSGNITVTASANISACFTPRMEWNQNNAFFAGET